MKKIHIDPHELRKIYYKTKSLRKTGEHFNTSSKTISNRLKEYKIPTLSDSEAKRIKWRLRIRMQKKCGKCKKWKPISDFRSDLAKWDNLRYECFSCMNQLAKEYRQRHPDRIKDSKKQYHQKNTQKHHIGYYREAYQNPYFIIICSKCGRVAHCKEFPINRKESNGFHSQCKECRNKYDREKYKKGETWHQRNPELKKKTDKEYGLWYYSRPELILKKQTRECIEEGKPMEGGSLII